MEKHYSILNQDQYKKSYLPISLVLDPEPGEPDQYKGPCGSETLPITSANDSVVESDQQKPGLFA
jgi:hypothetical protein